MGTLKHSLACYDGAPEIVEVRKSWQANKDAIIYKFREKQSKPFLSSKGSYLVLFALLASTVAAIIMHFTGFYDNTILRILSLKKDGLSYNLWREPQVPFYIYVYPFNYTNADEFLAGREKAKLEELGPYVYEERSVFTNLEFEGEELLTYTENRTHNFLPELSTGTADDLMLTPNIVYMSAISLLKNENMVTQWSASALIAALQPKAFREINIEELLFGQDDKFSLLIRKFKNDKKGNEPFGLLSRRNGIGYDRISIGTGVPNLSQLGVINKINGDHGLPWNGPSCNSIDGSDGSLFPAEDVKSSSLNLFNLQACRKVQLQYESESVANGLPARRFRLSSNVFSNATENPDNACFCVEDCPPNGVFSIAPCADGAPIGISYPHFLHGSEELFEDFEGLNPDAEKHSFFVDVHEIGVPLGGHTRAQLNLVVQHARHMSHLKTLKQGLVLPIAWLDVVLGDYQGVPRILLWHAAYTAKWGKYLIKWISLLAALGSAYVLILNYTAGKKPWC